MPRLFLCFFVLLASVLAAQDAPRPHFVRASGEAIISAKPDRAEVTIAVSTRAPTAQVAPLRMLPKALAFWPLLSNLSAQAAK